MGCVPPAPGFLEACARSARATAPCSIFDEVMTGFRVALGGAQALYGVQPDLTTLGKIVGGGMPVGAFGGRRDIMEQLAPLGPVYQAGTLSGNPVAMAAGLATLEAIAKPGLPCAPRQDDHAPRRGPGRRRARGRHSRRDQPRLRHVRPLLHGAKQA